MNHSFMSDEFGAIAPNYTGGMKGSCAVLRRIGIRTYTWLNCLYPIPC